MNPAEFELRLQDLVEPPFNPDTFVFDFMAACDASPTTITKLRQTAGDVPRGKKHAQAGDIVWPRKLHYRLAPSGQTASTLDDLAKAPVTKAKPRFLLATDGVKVHALDTKNDEYWDDDFAKLNDGFGFFGPLAGNERYDAVKENPADIKAAGRLSKLYDEIVARNPGWETAARRHALNQFMTRLLFCMFAEDTGSFAPDLFVKTISEYGGQDGEALQSLLAQMFAAMNLPDTNRAAFPAHIRAFPYVNGGLFADATEVPAFNKRAKRLLIEAAQLNWSEINPDIFGSMIQAVVDKDLRGELGMHYTSVPNIMKVLQPLFLMSLEEDFAAANGHRQENAMLNKLLRRIAKIRVFDPACGSGNFLIIAYRELRTLEMRIFQRLDEIGGGQTTWREQSGVKLSNFYGIELADFAAETAKLSLWIAEYQMNQRFKTQFGEAPPNFPLHDGGHIVCGNALRLDWLDVCPPPMKAVPRENVLDLATIVRVHGVEMVPDEEVETYIVGNPPYLGRGQLTAENKVDTTIVFSNKIEKYKSLDYVACFYMKYSDYCGEVSSSCAFVSTNSICQGEQASILWPEMTNRGLEISFAHRPFWWRNNASHNAAVNCVIVGLRQKSDNPKYIFEEAELRKAKNINPYLINMNNIVVVPSNSPLTERPLMVKGSQATDDGNLLLSRTEMQALKAAYPIASSFLRKFCGSQELTQGVERWCLWINDKDLEVAKTVPPIAARIEKVGSFRAASPKAATQEFAKQPHRFTEIRFNNAESIVVPKSTSERRQYITAQFLEQGAVVSDQAFALYHAPAHFLAILSSRMHYSWGVTVGGKFKMDPRYSNTIVYNTFPLPSFSQADEAQLESHAWAIIAAREAHPGKTIAWLYDPKTMPSNLLDAHRALDVTLEKIYIGRPFKNDTERLEHLFKRYAEMIAVETTANDAKAAQPKTKANARG
jgi:hypothetical protein